MDLPIAWEVQPSRLSGRIPEFPGAALERWTCRSSAGNQVRNFIGGLLRALGLLALEGGVLGVHVVPVVAEGELGRGHEAPAAPGAPGRRKNVNRGIVELWFNFIT